MTAAGARPRRWADLWPRVLSGLVLIALALATAARGGPLFAAFWLIAAVAVLWEWQSLIGAARHGPRFATGAVALAGAAALGDAGLWPSALAVLAAGIVATALLAGAALRWMAGAGVLYGGALVLSAILLRNSVPEGLTAILWLFAVVWGTDVMAYFGGRLIGGPKLWPRLSPAKTWSGFLVGVGCGALAGLAVSPATAAHGAVLAIGLVGGVVAQGGDLFESVIKRRYNVKDASHLIPGHGGVMDRLDGFITAAVFAALLGTLHGGVAAAGRGLFHW